MAAADRFPDGFQWGTATAAHQVEGGNWNNDWWVFEHTPGSRVVEPSGDACDSWHRWDEDVDLVASLGFGVYRFSVEWSRIEPEEGEFSSATLEQYRRMCSRLRERGVDPMVTFHHFTTPRWLVQRGGWERADTVDAFARFCERVATVLGDVMTSACTINEPNIVSTHGWAVGTLPPGRTDGALVLTVSDVLLAAHRKAVDVIRAVAPGTPVGMTLSMDDWAATEGGESNLELFRHYMEDAFLEATEGDDFIGVQAYSRTRVGPEGVLGPEPGVPVLPMGYEYWPQALEAAVRRAWEVTRGRVPVHVTENGIGTDDDRQRISYHHDALQGLLRAIADGVDVRGYVCWSLLDNFEWASGFGPRFGLVAVDRRTFARTPKPSAHWMGEVARANMLLPPPSSPTEVRTTEGGA